AGHPPGGAAAGEGDGAGGGDRPVEESLLDRVGEEGGRWGSALQEGDEIFGGAGGAEQVVGGRADQVAGGAVALGPGDAAQQGRRDPRRLALDQVGGGGDLVGDRDLGDLQRPGVAVRPPPPVPH